jgi:C-terminal processing protease CtpA/Prc
MRHRLYAAAMALSPVAWLLLLALGACGDALLTVGVLVGGIAGAGMMTMSVNAWARSVRHVPGRLSCMPVGPLIAGARTFLVGRGRRVLRAARSMVDASARNRLSRTACVTSAAIGMGLLLLPLLLAAPRGALAISPFFAGVASGALLLAAVAVWRASATGAPARPTGLLAFLAFASAVAFLAELAPAEYFLAAAALGLWWRFYYRRGTPLVAPGAMDRLRRRQPLLRFALGAALAVTLGMHLLLLQAAVRNQTGAMVFEALAEYHLYPVSDATLARAILNDQYLWRDSVSVAEARYVDSNAWWLLAKARDPRDRWSGTYSVRSGKTYERMKVTGFGVETREAPGGRGSLVSYVEGGSPAQRAGVRRGDVIRALKVVPPHLPGAPWDLTRLELVSATGEVREVLVAEAEYERSAVSVERVLEVAGRKVGYVELRSFREQADEDFLHAAERLRAQGIDELVLDLRMNPGGRVLALLRIASAIGGQRLDGKILGRLVHNDRYRERDQDLVLRSPPRGALSLSRIFIITTEDSCSASEGLINGLAPHMQVVTIGGTTCGKPVGSYSIDYGGTGFSVITFRVVNARGEGDYYNGLRPTCGADDDVRRDFGDPEEASLKAALHYIEHGRCPDPAVWL